MSTETEAPASAVLTIDLAAVAANYRLLSRRLARNARCAAVVKADAYGLGLAEVAPVLARAGARDFFVAELAEGLRLRKLVPNATIYVLNGLARAGETFYSPYDLRPVLNSLEEIARFRRLSPRPCAALQIDSGMARLGLPRDELDELCANPDLLGGIELALVMSHLACAEEPDNPLNRLQLERFEAARTRLPPAPASLANSSGIFLGSAHHFDLARPGAALYGINPTPGQASNPLSQVVQLKARILQTRVIDAPWSVGYGATFRAAGPTRIATVGIGYADGYLRSLSNRGHAWIEGQRVAVVGRVSMDLITLDVSALPPELARPGIEVTLMGDEQGPDELAAAAGTIGYEILTSLGRRYRRVYRGG